MALFRVSDFRGGLNDNVQRQCSDHTVNQALHPYVCVCACVCYTAVHNIHVNTKYVGIISCLFLAYLCMATGCIFILPGMRQNTNV